MPSGAKITQSFAISRYAGRLAKLYPDDAEEALYVDEIIDAVADILNGIPQTADLELRKTLREAFAAGKLNTYCSFLSDKLEANGPFFSGAKYSIADFHVYSAVKILRSGMFDHIAADYDAKWPAIGAFIVALENDPLFAPYKI